MLMGWHLSRSDPSGDKRLRAADFPQQLSEMRVLRGCAMHRFAGTDRSLLCPHPLFWREVLLCATSVVSVPLWYVFVSALITTEAQRAQRLHKETKSAFFKY